MASIEDKKVLIVDDDENSLLIAKILFKRHGINNLQVSKNGDDAINFIRKDLFDIILMDIRMP